MNTPVTATTNITTVEISNTRVVVFFELENVVCRMSFADVCAVWLHEVASVCDLVRAEHVFYTT